MKLEIGWQDYKSWFECQWQSGNELCQVLLLGITSRPAPEQLQRKGIKQQHPVVDGTHFVPWTQCFLAYYFLKLLLQLYEIR